MSPRQIDSDEHRVALASTEALLKELKQLDDKIILTEVYMLESRAAHAIQNLPRAKVSYFVRIHSPLAHLLDRIDKCSNYRKLDLLSSPAPSFARPSIRCSASRRQGLQDWVLLLLRGVRGVLIA